MQGADTAQGTYFVFPDIWPATRGLPVLSIVKLGAEDRIFERPSPFPVAPRTRQNLAPPRVRMVVAPIDLVSEGSVSQVVVRQRLAEGYPVPLLMQVVRTSNGLLTGTGMLLAILSGKAAVAKQMAAIQPAFADCLPQLLTAPAG